MTRARAQQTLPTGGAMSGGTGDHSTIRRPKVDGRERFEVCEVAPTVPEVLQGPERVEEKEHSMRAIKDAAAEFLATSAWPSPASRGAEGPRQQRRLQAPARARLRGVRGQPERGRGRGRPRLPRPALDPRRRRGGGDRNTARARRGDDARVRRARDQARVDAPRPRRRQRLRRRRPTYGREHGITVIDGGCPCMFGPTADLGHKAMRFVFTLTGNVPKEV